MAKKQYVLDTNVLLHDATSVFKFAEHTIILPIVVLEELDTFKKDSNDKGRNARHVTRLLDVLRESGNLVDGVILENGGTLRVLPAPALDLLPEELQTPKPDHYILATAHALNTSAFSCTLVTKDINLRIKADALDVPAEDYYSGQVNFSELYTGRGELNITSCQLDDLYTTSGLSFPASDEFFPNQMFTLTSTDTHQHSGLAYYDFQAKTLRRLSKLNKVYGVSPRNLEQQFALALLLNPEISVVTLLGQAGTGKTLLAIAAGFQLVTELQMYSRVLVSRPIFPLGRDLGFLPGEINEKLAPWMQPIFDNVDYLLNIPTPEESGRVTTKASKSSSRIASTNYSYLVDSGLLKIEPLTYIRGRSIPNQFMIVDEAQNLTPHEIKTILTRAGEGTKIVLTGDPYQIDNPYVDAASNGLSYLVEQFKSEPLAGHIILTKGERSPLAERAAQLL